LRKARLCALSIVVVSLLAGCGDDDAGPSTPTTSSTTAATSTTTSTSAKVTTTAKGQAANVLGEKGIGKLQLGMSLAAAKATGEIGTVGPGCELAGPSEQSAPLKSGTATGSVTFTDGVLTRISVRSGAKTAAGVGPGSTIAQIQQAYGAGYEVEVDHDTEEQFGITLVTVLRGGGRLFDFDVPTDSGKAMSVTIPRLGFCE
jgi:hypothetical protein